MFLPFNFQTHTALARDHSLRNMSTLARLASEIPLQPARYRLLVTDDLTHVAPPQSPIPWPSCAALIPQPCPLSAGAF